MSSSSSEDILTLDDFPTSFERPFFVLLYHSYREMSLVISYYIFRDVTPIIIQENRGIMYMKQNISLMSN